MFCLKCGTELPEGSKFCNHCGASLAAVGQTEEMKERTDPAGIPEENETAVALDPALNGRGIQDYIGDTTANPASRKRVPILVYVLPIVSLVIVAALLDQFMRIKNRLTARSKSCCSRESSLRWTASWPKARPRSRRRWRSGRTTVCCWRIRSC